MRPAGNPSARGAAILVHVVPCPRLCWSNADEVLRQGKLPFLGTRFLSRSFLISLYLMSSRVWMNYDRIGGLRFPYQLELWRRRVALPLAIIHAVCASPSLLGAS